MNTAFKILPKNYLEDWGEFESWSMGVGSAPDGWLIASSAVISQETSDIKFGVYSVVVSGGGSQGSLYRTIPDGESLAGRTFKLGAWCKSVSTGPYIKLSDGVSSSTVHLDGTNAMVELTTPSLKLDANATELRLDFVVPSGVDAVFDSAVLCEGEDLFTSLSDGNVLVDAWTPSLVMRQDEFQISQKEGTFVPETHLSGRSVRVRGTVSGSDVPSARLHFDKLMKGVLAWQTNEMRSIYLYDDRVMEVFLKGFDWNYVRTLSFIRYNMNITAPRSTTRYINKFRNREVVASTINEFNFTYSGSHESRPIISFIADQGSTISTCQLQNLTTGQEIIYSGTVPSGVALDIDCDKGTVFNSSINRIDEFGTSDFIKLVRGENYFRYTGTLCTINIDYFERFL